MGRAGIEFTLHFDDNYDGKRVVIIRWLDTDEVSVRAIRGDGRGTTFKTYEEAVVLLAPEQQISWRERGAELARAVADRHFA